MVRFLTLGMLVSIAFAQASPPAGPRSARDSEAHPASHPGTAVVHPLDLPPLPRVKSTIIGGRIRDLDRVRDQFTLNVFGGRTMKILFDQRTQIYRDGVKTSLRTLRAGDPVSVETSLDGTQIFARSIHTLSQAPEGECQGQVLKYTPGDGELIVRDVISHEPVKLRVVSDTKLIRQDQARASADPAVAKLGPSDLATGTLLSAKFRSDDKGHGVASQITILATPGTAFVFVGSVATLDLRSGLLVLVDPRTDKRYEIFFDSARFPMSRDLHVGADLAVTADFDGTRYVASAVTLNSATDN